MRCSPHDDIGDWRTMPVPARLRGPPVSVSAGRPPVQPARSACAAPACVTVSDPPHADVGLPPQDQFLLLLDFGVSCSSSGQSLIFLAYAMIASVFACSTCISSG